MLTGITAATTAESTTTAVVMAPNCPRARHVDLLAHFGHIRR